MDRDALVEQMAEAAYSAGIAPWPWEKMSEGGKAVWLVMLDAALTVAEEVVRSDEAAECQRIAREACLVPPDGGSPTSEEKACCDAMEAAIRARHTPKENDDDR